MYLEKGAIEYKFQIEINNSIETKSYFSYNIQINVQDLSKAFDVEIESIKFMYNGHEA